MKKLSLILLLICSNTSFGQGLFERSDTLNSARAIATVGVQTTTAVGSLAGLHIAWYSNYDQEAFHFFNDWPGWMQMDKIGHATSAYQISANMHRLNTWAGLRHRPSMWYSALSGWGYLLAVEILDGFSEAWGFSNYDLMFNTAGTGLFLGQELILKSQPIKLKFSFSPSGLHKMNELGDNQMEVQRANALYGKSIFEQWLKDYNGQTYWLSANIWGLTGKGEKFPKWLNISLGYSVNNLLGAESNAWLPDRSEERYTSDLVRQRQLLLSLDVDLDHVKLPNYLIWLRPVFGVIKLPFPALEWNSVSGIKAHGIYF